jgi:glycosyltransferase involved in cell wall biosynthesis
LAEAGVSEDKINIVPHGPLLLPEPARSRAAPPRPAGALKTFVLFGQMKAYKGIDILVDAVAALPQALRDRSRFVVAGSAMMDMTPIETQIEAAGLKPHIELRYGRLSEEEMADLFHEADVFILPYRAIDASGVFYLLRPQAKWIIASRVGVFTEDFMEGVDGETVHPGDVEDLARAIGRAIERDAPGGAKARGASWTDIGLRTRAIYERAIGAKGSAAETSLFKPAEAA